MKPLGIRFCTVSTEAEALATFFDKLGFERKSLEGILDGEGFLGAIFEAGGSWIEIWPVGEGMPAGTMLQVVVDNADSVAATARAAGIEPKGPMDAHGERIYFAAAPGGLQIAFQSALD